MVTVGLKVANMCDYDVFQRSTGQRFRHVLYCVLWLLR